MSDMQAFERQLERRIHRSVGPARSVDDLAVFDAVMDAGRPRMRGFTMFSALKFVAAAVVVALFGRFQLAGVQTTPQEERDLPAAPTAPPTAEATSEILLEMVVPRWALPDDVSAVEFADWVLEAGADSTGEPEASQANESMRSRAFLVLTGELLIEPTTEALLWRGPGAPQIAPAGEAATLGPGEVIYLPAVADGDIDDERHLRLANPGADAATGLTFHVHEGSIGDPFGGFPAGLMWESWPGPLTAVMNGSDWSASEEALFRISRHAGGPGSVFEVPIAPATAVYPIEAGAVEHSIAGEPHRKWTAHIKGQLMAVEGVDQALTVVGDDPASFLELVALPR